MHHKNAPPVIHDAYHFLKKRQDRYEAISDVEGVVDGASKQHVYKANIVHRIASTKQAETRKRTEKNKESSK